MTSDFQNQRAEYKDLFLYKKKSVFILYKDEISWSITHCVFHTLCVLIFLSFSESESAFLGFGLPNTASALSKKYFFQIDILLAVLIFGGILNPPQGRKIK